MHDTAFRIGGLILSEYCTLEDADVLEIGAYNVNGSLRDHAFATTRYVGLDLEAGPGVDIVSEPGKPYSVADDAFDLVLASSVLEHDGMFWMTFLEMCRKARPGGYIYISVPANGTIHRYPEDNWRFYPDSGKSLVRWAQSQGMEVELVESFTAERAADHWNDYCAVFRKGPSSLPLPKNFVHELVSCTNVVTWQSEDMIHVREDTEDMVLLKEARTRNLELESALTEHERIVAEIALLRPKVEETAARLAISEEALRQLNEEIKQTRTELELERSSARTVRAARDLALEGVARLEVALAGVTREKSQVDSRLAKAEQVCCLMKERLRQEEAARQDEIEHTRWLHEVTKILAAKRPWWWALMPTPWRDERLLQQLKEQGLSDAEGYVSRNRDIFADHGIRSPITFFVA